MTRFLFEPPQVRAVPVVGEDAVYPVHRVFCVGRNYVEHAREMGQEVDREKPFYFTKSALAVTATGSTVPYPPGTDNFHYEMELVVALGAPAFRATVEQGMAAVFGYACGLDMTRRDLQLSERAKQRPWDLGKDVENSAVVAPITKAAEFGAVGPQRIWLSLNGTVKQDATLDDLVWKVGEIVSHLSHFYHLGAGDLIFTGTPAGVGPVVAGDAIEGGIDGLTEIALAIGPAEQA